MSKKILIVNDSIELLQMMQELLESEGYEVKIHSARMKDLEMVKEYKPDLVITDQLFGGAFTGWEFAQRVRLDRETSGLPIIICTAAIEIVKQLDEQLHAKNIRVILKPFDIDDLLTTVSEALGELP